MRKVLALLLLAGVATPAFAADPGDHFGRHRESGTQSKSEDRGTRSNGDSHARFNRGNDGGEAHSQPVVHVESNGGNDHPQRVMHIESNSGGGGNADERRFHRGAVSGMESGEQLQPTHHDTLRGTTTNVRSEDSTRFRGPKLVEPTEDRTSGDLREQRNAIPHVFRNRVPIVSTTPREGTQPPLRVERRRTNTINWSSTHWRNDKRYDWKDWRRRHRSIFHIGIYSDPFGWNYRPYSIGWRLWPSYFGSRYWITNPWYYRLPYAPPGYRWVRYYDDALLVDTWTGEVVDVIYDFFW